MGRRLALFISMGDNDFYKQLWTPNARNYANSIGARLKGDIPDLDTYEWDLENEHPLVWGYKTPVRGASVARGGGRLDERR